MQGEMKQTKPEGRLRAWRSGDSEVWLARLRRLAGELFWGCGAWLLGQSPMLFDTYPLGVALLSASHGHTLSILIGLILSAFWQMNRPGIYIAAYLAAALIPTVSATLFDLPEVTAWSDRLRGKLRQCRAEAASVRVGEAPEPPRRGAWRRFFSDSLCLRMASVGLSALAIALWRVIEGGFRYYDFFAAVFLIAAATLATVIWSCGVGQPTEDRGLLELPAKATLLVALVWSANGISVSGFPLCVMLAFFFSLHTTRRRGVAAGVAAALLVGVAYDPMHAPGLVLAALIYAFFHSLKKQSAAIALAVPAFLLWTTYVEGATSLFLLLPSVLAAAAAFRLYCALFKVPDEAVVGENAEADRRKLEGERYRDSNARFRGISDAFSSLSEMFYNLSDRFRRPGTLDLRQICDRSFDRFCPDCPNKSVCWGLEYSSTLHTVSGLVSALHTKGRVTRTQIPSGMAHRCESTDAILEGINRECARLTGEMLRNNRTEIFAMDYESAAEIINDALEEDDSEYRFDPALEEKIAEYLTDAGIRAQSVTVYGKRRRQILVRGIDIEQASVTLETLRADLGELCGMEPACPIFSIEDRVNLMTLAAKKKIGVICAQSNLSADGGVSGDSVNLFSNKKDYFYALICDGMGAGREAALTSGLCSVFLEKMLRAGNRAATSLRMLNNMIRSRAADSTRECSSTVDLLELDLMTGEGSFMKSGAAPGFLIHRGVVQHLQSGSAPIGIISALDVQSTKVNLRVGDTVVMVSDGILQDDPDAVELAKYLAGAGKLTPEEIVYHVCLGAAKKERHDDCSVLALRITEAEE